MEIQRFQSIQSVDETRWNDLVREHPFQSYAFFHALETSRCIGPHTGWNPAYILLIDDDRYVAAAAVFVKTHSMGEFVYDFSWAAEAQRYGIPYYPKLVVGAPFSPVTGTRLHALTPEYRALLLRAVRQFAEENRCVGTHILFCPKDEATEIQALGAGFTIREGFQYIWENQGYQCFDDFLQALRSRRRKEIRRERNAVHGRDIQVKPILGSELLDHEIETIHELYRRTCESYIGGDAYLNLTFFREFIRNAGDHTVFFAAIRNEEIIAGSFCVFTNTHLFGRYWGSREDVPGLHFEACFYRPIEWAIERGITYFEPGAGGEHKFNRGFLPAPTFSLHRHEHPGFNQAIQRFCDHEATQVKAWIHEMKADASPFQRNDQSSPK